MPWLEDEQSRFYLGREMGMDPIESQDDSTFKEKLRAAYRLENTFGSFFSQEQGLPDSYVQGEYDAWEDMTEEERLDSDFIENAALADNQNELNALRKQRSRELKDRDTLSKGGFIPSMAAAIVDPVNLIPVGGASYRTYRTGATILEGAAVTGAAAAGRASIAEAGLQYSQVERSFGESATNVAAAALFGSVIGSAPGVLRQILDDPELPKTMDPEGRIAAGENPAFSDGSISAASVDFDPKIRGKVAQEVTKWLGFDPLSRTVTSDNKATRQLSGRLAENPLDVDTPGHQAVETKVKIYDGLLYKALTEKETNI